MARNAHYDILFEPVKIGPVTAPNRFFQVPHASGMTNSMPRMRAGFREMKAEGGWGVVCTGYVSIHPSADDTPLPMAKLWDDADIRSHAMMTDAVHRHGSLAGVELFHGGGMVMNRTSRIAPISPSGIGWMPPYANFMSHLRPRAMTRDDIADIRRWQADAARRAKDAGFDIVYVYGAMGYLPHQFLLPDFNRREDEYGGSVENRARFLRELLDVTRDAVGPDVAVATRISLEQLRARPGTVAETEAHEVVDILSDHVDLFDVKMDSGPIDCPPSRFRPEGSHEPVIDFVKRVTDKPVVGVGRFTSPDTMVGQVKRGVLDLIGAARPSIADPFLPNKIRDGHEDEIRECIGCNMCIASWHDGVPVRCTQNPSAGEEWRRGWHPERIAPKGLSDHVLIVGGGPSGLEAALSLGRRGYQVTVADAAAEFGGRLRFEAELPGLRQWHRVIDYRLGRLSQMANVSLYTESDMDEEGILEFGADRVAVATGSRWLPDLMAVSETPGDLPRGPRVYTPSDIANGAEIEGPVAVFDYDNYYMGSAIAEYLRLQGKDVTYVSPAGHVSTWSIMSNDLPTVQERLLDRGVALRLLTRVTGFDGDTLQLADFMGGRPSDIACRSLVVVGRRQASDGLATALNARPDDLAVAGVRSVEAIGDAHAPGSIVHAVYFGRAYAEGLDGRSHADYRYDGPVLPDGLDGPVAARTTPNMRAVS